MICFHLCINNITAIKDSNSDRYLVIVQVFNELSNVKSYISSVDVQLQYRQLNNKYYVFVFSAKQRKEVEIFRANYKEDCWILDLK